ncbi:MAG: diguanylate cyclase [Solirubrobacteraceae bacterium]|nr:diguanylate cyclase [Solirubrobacteraceae bacterium]
MPELAGAGRPTRIVAGAGAATMLAALVVHLLHTTVGLGGSGVGDAAMGVGLIAAAAVLLPRAAAARTERGSWWALAIGVTLWVSGALVSVALGRPESEAVVSPSDALWLLFYPCAYVAVALRTRASLQGAGRSLWLDGVIGMLTVAAVGWLLVVEPIVDQAPDRHLATLVNATYVIADLVLIALTVGVCALQGWRAGRAWAMLAAGLAGFAAADSLFLLRVADGSFTAASPLDSLWGVGLVLMALAAWQPSRPPRPAAPGLAILVPPFAFSFASLGVLITTGVEQDPVAVVLAACAVCASMARTALTFNEVRGVAEARRLAATDDLTGLPNRRHFDRRLRGALGAARARGGSLALLLIDLDRFKELNDTLGHRAGDLVLAQIGPRLSTVLRAGDVLARLGGDEFAVLLPDAAGAEAIGRRIGGALDERFTVDGIEVQIGASIGIAVVPEHGADAETLLQRADIAMYQAKASQSGHAFYARERDRHSRERLALGGELRDAIGTEQLILHYQPKLDVATGEVHDVEALVRWQHPTRGLLAPGSFIALAEQTGAMPDLTRHVVDAALAQCASWRERGLDLGVAVNVSAATLLDAAWADDVDAALARHRVPPSRLRIEVTEDTVMVDPERALALLQRLAGRGVGVSLDDFGTGHSSLALLKHLPVDELKIDRTFIRDLLVDDADAAIVQTVVDLGRRLGLTVVAEGVEDAATLDRLAGAGVAVAQGFHIARPLPAAELEQWLGSARPVAA